MALRAFAPGPPGLTARGQGRVLGVKMNLSIELIAVDSLDAFSTQISAARLQRHPEVVQSVNVVTK